MRNIRIQIQIPICYEWRIRFQDNYIRVLKIYIGFKGRRSLSDVIDILVYLALIIYHWIASLVHLKKIISKTFYLIIVMHSTFYFESKSKSLQKDT